MNVKLRTLIVTAVATLIFTGVAEARVFISDPNQPDTVRVDSVRALRGSHVAIPIFVFTDEPLYGIEITIRHQSPHLKLDSFSFLGSIHSYLEFKGATFIDGAMAAYAFPTSDFFIYPGRGLFGKIYATVSDSAAIGPIALDSATVIVEMVEHSNMFSDLELQTFIPQFRAGKIQVQDSCCVGMKGNIDGSPDEGIDISDLTILINYLFLDFNYVLVCPEEADVSPETGDGTTDISDLTALVQFLFISATPLPDCR